MKAATLFIAQLLLAGTLCAQIGACEVRSADTSLFRLTVKGLSLGDSASSEWRFAAAPGTYEIHIFPEDSASHYMNSSVEIVPGKTRTYELFFGADRLEFALGIAAEMTYRENQAEVMLSDTTLQAVREMNSGIAGQFPPLVDPDFENLLGDLRETFFQNERAELIREYLSGHRVTIDQVRQMLSSIDAEDRRLELTLSAAGSLDAPERLTELEDLFYLNSSKQRLRRVASAAGD